MEKLAFDLEDGRTIVLNFDYIDDIDVNQFTRIDYSNLMGEYLTSSYIMNGVANIRSEVQNVIAETNLEYEVWYSNKFKEFYRGKEFKSKDAVDSAIKTLPEYKKFRLKLIQYERNLAFMDNLYWGLKNKSDKIDKLYASIPPEDFKKELVEGQINKVLIKIKTSSIK